MQEEPTSQDNQPVDEPVNDPSDQYNPPTSIPGSDTSSQEDLPVNEPFKPVEGNQGSYGNSAWGESDSNGTEPTAPEAPKPFGEPYVPPAEPAPLSSEPPVAFGPEPVNSTPTYPASPVFGAPAPAAGSQPLSGAPVAKGKFALPKWLKSKKVWIPLVAAAIVLVMGGSAFAYVSWYQTPQKVLSDAVVNAFTNSSVVYTGTLSVDSNGSTLKVEITSKRDGSASSLEAKVTATVMGKTYNVNADALYDKSGDIYFKLANIKSVITDAEASYMNGMPASVKTAIDKFVDRVDNKWIKISADDLTVYSKEASDAQKCTQKAIDKFSNDKTSQNEVADVYRNNAFIVIDKDLGSKDGSIGYELAGSNVKLKAFVKNLKTTQLYKSLHDCDNSFVLDENQINTDKDTTSSSDTATVTVWVGAWDHKFTKFEVASKGDSTTKASLTIIPDYNQKVTITAPTDFITLTQLKSYIDELLASYSSAL